MTKTEIDAAVNAVQAHAEAAITQCGEVRRRLDLSPELDHTGFALIHSHLSGALGAINRVLDTDFE